MSCTRYRQLISRYVDDEVTPRQRQELLAHVEHCSDCAAWLARARQTDVLLKSVKNTGPSDSVRQAILSQLHTVAPKAESSKQNTSATKQNTTVHRSPLRALISALLLRFDPSPRRIIFGSASALVATLCLLNWLNVLPPVWNYNKLGFEVQDQSDSLSSTPIPIRAVSGNYGADSAMAAPNLTLVEPATGAQVSLLTQPLVIRFDQPMARSSVEDALSIVPPVAGQIAWDADNELRWTPTGTGLLRGITYTVTLSDSALSQSGAALPRPAVWSFHTADAHTVTASVPDGASVRPLASFTLRFDAPMVEESAQSAVSFRTSASGSFEDVPATFMWDTAGKLLTVTPLKPLPEGDLSLAVGAQAVTRAGDTLGRSFEFSYHATLPASRLHLLDTRIATAHTGTPISLRYDASGPEQVFFDVYSFPAEKLSDLAAQSSEWPEPLPAAFPGNLPLVATVSSNFAADNGVAHISSLPAGIYLLVAHASSSAGNPNLTDWQLMLVGNGSLVSTGPGLPLWAVNDAGHSWEGAEISFYSPDGKLLDKGLTNAAGLLLPGTSVQGAALAIARDPFGRIAPLVLRSSSTRAGTSTAVGNADLPATIVTDRPSYPAGTMINFRSILMQHPSQSGPNDTLPTGADNNGNVAVQFLTPQGCVVAALSLKPDGSQGVSGTFPVASTSLPGVYTIRVRQGSLSHDFPVDVLPSRSDSLSVAILPTAEAQTSSTGITYTVSVLGANGNPASATLITATLRIEGDTWASLPVTATTDANGMAVLSLPLPSWFDRFNEPAIYLHAAAGVDGLQGSDDLPLDFTSQANTASGQTQIVAPDLNVAVVARPLPTPDQQESPPLNTGFLVRAVLLDPSIESGDILLLAQAPSGERLSYPLDLFSKPGGDATFVLPRRFAGGTIRVFSATSPSGRVLSLLPVGNASAELRVRAPISATAASAIPVALTLSDADGISLQGHASLAWRRVSGVASDRPLDWQAAVVLTSTGGVTTTLQTPSEPGLWYLMSESVTADGVARGFAAVRVLPGVWVQLPPAPDVRAGNSISFSVRVHNPGAIDAYPTLQAAPRGDLQLSGDASRSVTVSAVGWTDVGWQASQLRAGGSSVVLSFSDNSGMLASWPLPITFTPNSETSTTYTAGVLSGERTVGVSVPWGLNNAGVSMEIRASTSLLPALGGITRDLLSRWAPPEDGVSLAAARLGASGAVASAYTHAGATVPSSLLLSSVQRSVILQQLYSSQHADGSWSSDLDPSGPGSLRETAAVLLAFQRARSFPSGGDAALQPEQSVLDRAVAYLAAGLSRPLPASPAASVLEERAFSLYVLSLYVPVAPDWLQPMLAYVISDPMGAAPSFSTDGLGWLALAFYQSGNTADARALLDAVLRSRPSIATEPSAPFLLALLRADNAPGAQGQTTVSPSQIVTALMEARAGSGWRTTLDTADTLVALALYSTVEDERPRTEPPSILLDDHAIQPSSSPDNPAEVSFVLSGDDLHAGTNWLKLRSPVSGQTVYYSLTLIASR
jgi:hypothetical protein